MKRNILNYTLPELELIVKELKEEKYRAKQIFTPLHQKHISHFKDIKSIPLAFRKKLSENFYIGSLSSLLISDSKKYNTKKFLFILPISDTKNNEEKLKIETVLISEKGRHTICISTQVGCNVGCEFCATGKMGLKRNLETSEIISQVYEVVKATGLAPTNLVYMGMGEPFLNYKNLIKSLTIFTSKDGLNISSRRITVSTIGLKNKIKIFADDLSKKENQSLRNIKVAFSLHSTDNGIRESIIPTSAYNKLSDIYEELTYYYKKLRTKITYEYIYFNGINNSDDDIKRLERLSKMVPCNFNIIPFHPIDFHLNKPLDVFNKLDKGKIDERNEISLLNLGLNDFIAKLKSKKIIVNLRSSSGVDINAACGQLAVIN
ncbi:MAG: 23S rRNA (adenine(2503)-C(2))-methyltransferase RlmN [Ignavibacteria bacterium]|nr:23S rRNA (adenine(2503)-C(2))-methyltransferase RlmN [Ignavibacteria bacterium]